MGRKSKVWEVRDDLRPLLKTVKHLYPTLLGHIHTHRIFLCGFHNRSSGFIARVTPNRLPWALVNTHYDYCLTFWSTRFDAETVPYKHYVVLHELFHIPDGGHDPENRRTYRKCVDHDIEDFSLLLKSYGIHMEKVEDVMKGERKLFKEEDGPRRFPRIAHIK